jgi:hypothetical protein
MPDSLITVLGIAFVVLLLTLIGHGIWVFLAFMFRGFRPKRLPQQVCGFCGRSNPVGSRDCAWCCKDLTTPLAKELRDIEAVQRQLLRWSSNGSLKKEVATKLLEQVKTYRQRLIRPEGRGATITAPQPAVALPPVVHAASLPPIRTPAAAVTEVPLVAAEAVEEPRRSAEPIFAQTSAVAAKGKAEEFIAKQQAVQTVARGQDGLPAKAQVAAPPRPVAPLPPPRPPRKSFGEVLGTFLAERDIHVTELVGVLLGGLLMVGASVMFVIAYWNRLEAYQPLKFSVFVGYSSVVFAAGLFAFHRWKLQATGRGLMTIGILLVPLNLLLMASSKADGTMVVCELVALGVFGWLVALAGKALTRGGQWPMVAAVIGNSVLILYVGQFLHGQVAAPLWILLGFGTAGIFVAASFWHLRQVGEFAAEDAAKEGPEKTAAKTELADKAAKAVNENATNATERQAVNSLFMLLAVAAYSTIMGLAFVAAQASIAEGSRLSLALQLLAAPMCLAAVPMLGVGLHLNRRIPRDGRLESHRTVATMFALLGALVQTAALCFAWPHPVLLAAVGVLAAGCLAYLALRYDFPSLHAGAMFGATIAYLAIAFALIGEGRPNWQATSLLMQSSKLGESLLYFVVSSQSGIALSGLFVAFAAISEYFARRKQKNHGLIYAAGCGVVAVLGLSLVTRDGWRGDFTKGVYAAILYAMYGVVGVLLSFRWDRKRLSYIGGNLLAVAPFWLLQKFDAAIWQHDFALAACLLWVAIVWFALAWRHRSAVTFTVHQILLSTAALAGAFAWLVGHGSISAGSLPRDFLTVYNLQAFAAALAALSLAWAVVRIVARRSERLGELLNPPWLPVDKIVGGGLVVVQAFALMPFVVNGVRQEIQPSAAVSYFQNYCGPTAWILLSLLALNVVVALWDRWEKSHLIYALILAASVACLIAGRFAADAANASASRWGLAATFVIVSAAIWSREWLFRRLTAWGAKIDLEDGSPLLARVVAAALTAVPVVAIMVFMALTQLTGTLPVGPSAGVFKAMGPNWSYLVPLALVIVATVGHALRESSAVNAFLAGLVVELAVMLGYPLHLATANQHFGLREFTVWVQLMTIAAAVWAIAWLVARRWVNVWREEPNAKTSQHGLSSIPSVLMNTQLGFGVLGNIIVLGLALQEIIADGMLDGFSQAGTLLEWAAFATTVAAGGYRTWQRGREFSPHAVGLTGLTVLALVACTVSNMPMLVGTSAGSTLPYRVLMISWACYALLIAIATWWVASQRTLPEAEGPPQALIRLAAVWVRVAGIAAVLLGLKAGFLHDDLDSERLWAAAAIAIASVAGATMAVWRRREGWAFCAAVGVNVAASLVVWHVEETRGLLFEQWWLRLVQANVIASSLVGLVWLAAHRRLYQLRVWSVRESPLLAVQIALPIVANIAILALPVLALIEHPKSLAAWMHGFADAPGCLGLLLATAAGAWYLERTMPGRLIHVLAALGLGAGVLIACGSHAFGPFFAGECMEYRALFSTWTAAAAILLTVTYVANLRQLANVPKLELAKHFPTDAGKLWVSAIGILAAALVARSCAWDVDGIRWSLAAVGTLVVVMGLIAIWLRSAEHVYFSGLLVNLAGVAAWFVWGRKSVWCFLEFQVLWLAGASAAWTLLGFAGRDLVPHPQIAIGNEKRALPFAHLAIGAAIFLLTGVVAFAVFGDLSGTRLSVYDNRLGWIGLASVAAVLAIMLWDRCARYPWLGFYLAGIVAAGMLWLRQPLAPQVICWRAASDLAAVSLIAALMGRFMPFVRRGSRFLLIPDGENRWARQWFMPSQAVLATVAVLLGVWLAVDFRFTGLGKNIALFGIAGRYTGVTSLLMLLGTTILMAAQVDKKLRDSWQFAAFVIGLLFMAAIRWASLDASDPLIISVPWLHRSISLLISAAMMCLLVTFGLPLVAKRVWAPFFPANPVNLRTTWSDAGRRVLPYFGGLALLLVATVLVQEGLIFNPDVVSPVSVLEVLTVAAVMAAMLVLVLDFALRKDADPLGLSQSGRQAYVYAAEVLLALIWLHVWMTHPDLFRLHIMRKFWMFIIMGVAFAGAWLSELFRRRRLPVLSQPLERTALLLPVLPAVGFWLIHPDSLNWGLLYRTPLIWFFVGGFYGMMAYMRRSWVCGVLAVLTANMGLWVALTLGGFRFTERPQLWLIPIALCGLVAEYLNRERLSNTQSTLFRYIGLSTIYISSTAEMFMNGIAGHFWLPVVLMLLAVAGALAGVLLRIRSFLILGVVFLVIDLASLIRYAAVDLEQTWLWYVSFIALGAAIIAVFAVFEKRRNDVVAAMEKLKQWER